MSRLPDAETQGLINEQLRRARNVWSNEPFSEADLSSMRLRLMGRHKRSSRFWVWLGVPLVLGAGTALAAAGGYLGLGEPRETKEATLVTPDPKPNSASGIVHQKVEEKVMDVELDPEPTLPVDQGGEPIRLRQRNTPAVRAGWEQAADALSKGDIGRAEDAFSRIERGGDANAVERARLARAELYLKTGDRARALPLLKSLSESAKSPSVATRAKKLMSP